MFSSVIPLMEAIRTIPAIKDCDVESVLAIAGTTTVANTDTAIFAEDAHHFATSDLYNLESFGVLIYLCHNLLPDKILYLQNRLL